MTLISLLRNLIRDVRTWDKPSQTALMMALCGCVGFALGSVFAPLEWRQYAAVGLIGMVIVLQAIILWGNRRLVTPYAQAQRCFMAGDFERALALLEELERNDKADVRTLTLLGNTYRQMGRLNDSERVLRVALDKESLHPFPLYGFGRTLLSKGKYHEAVTALENAVRAGMVIAQFDLGETHYRLGNWQQAQSLLQTIRPSIQEPYRVLMIDYLLFRMGKDTAPPPNLVQTGLPYWQESVKRFAETPYGATLAEDVRQMQSLTQEH
jgi:tetratricopeptide (TPR) repeat protein